MSDLMAIEMHALQPMFLTKSDAVVRQRLGNQRHGDCGQLWSEGNQDIATEARHNATMITGISEAPGHRCRRGRNCFWLVLAFHFPHDARSIRCLGLPSDQILTAEAVRQQMLPFQLPISSSVISGHESEVILADPGAVRPRWVS